MNFSYLVHRLKFLISKKETWIIGAFDKKKVKLRAVEKQRAQMGDRNYLNFFKFSIFQIKALLLLIHIKPIFHFIPVLRRILQEVLGAYSELRETTKIDRFPRIFNDFQLLTIFRKRFILDVWQGSSYAFGYLPILESIEISLK